MRSPREGDGSDLVEIDQDDPEPEIIERTVDRLRAGGIAVFPTDTIYGLGCSGESALGLSRLRELKGMARTSPFILLVADRSWAPRMVLSVTPLAERLMDRFWPGPLTIVLDAAPGLGPDLASEAGTIALRLPRSRLCLSLCEKLAAPIASTSANRGGEPPVTGAAQAARELAGHVDVVLDGGPPRSDLPSTIVDARGEEPVILRAGCCDPETRS